MNKLSYKIATGLTTGAIVLSSMAPAAFAATDIKVNGNGKKSTNTVGVANTKTTAVTQSNTAMVGNITVVGQNTGSNKANGNTGGNVKVKTGSTSSVVSNTTTTGGNVASSNCGCEPADTAVAVKNNGKKSINTVSVSNTSVSTTTQINTAIVVNGSLVLQNTGDNKAKDNTGGNVKVKTGDTSSEVTNDVMTGGNEVAPVTP